METRPVVVSARPDALGRTAQVTERMEVKLDWEDAERLLDGPTLATRCTRQGVDPTSVASVHLPPGTANRIGMSIAPASTGTITSFTHAAFGADIDPDWLTVHTTRTFDYHEHVDRLGTITELTGHALAIENTPDESYYYTPEDIAAIAYLTDEIPALADVSVLLDTAHVDASRTEFTVESDAVTDIVDRMEDELADRFQTGFERYLDENRQQVLAQIEDADGDLPPLGSTWRSVLVTMALAGLSQIRAIHLNDPDEDGLPSVDHGGDDGLRALVSLCRSSDIDIILEPGDADLEAIADVCAVLEHVE